MIIVISYLIELVTFKPPALLNLEPHKATVLTNL